LQLIHQTEESAGVGSPSTLVPVARSGQALPVTVIKPSGTWPSLGLRELWRYRELLFFLAWRDVKVKYKQTLVGVLWIVVQPVMTMLIFTFVFGRLAGLPSQGIPYPLFVLAGLVPWQLFANSLTGSTVSVVGSGGLISKVYFPRLIIPFATVLGGIVDFVIALGILGVLMGWYGTPIGWRILALPVIMLFAILTALSVGLWLSMLNVQFRDVQFTIPFLTQIWLFCSPVAYAGVIIPPNFKFLFALNPMTGVINGFRWSLLGANPQFGYTTLGSVLAVGVLLTGGIMYFRHAEKTFVDVI
jgi:lipopolysaccharide transport system permease protein